jgi:hypothetical protein
MHPPPRTVNYLISDGGLDHPVNCAAITPNVHREIHFGQNGKHLAEKLGQSIKHKEALLDMECPH